MGAKARVAQNLGEICRGECGSWVRNLIQIYHYKKRFAATKSAEDSYKILAQGYWWARPAPVLLYSLFPVPYADSHSGRHTSAGAIPSLQQATARSASGHDSYAARPVLVLSVRGRKVSCGWRATKDPTGGLPLVCDNSVCSSHALLKDALARLAARRYLAFSSSALACS